MKTTAFIEAGSLLDGTRVFRMNCPSCKRTGIWQRDLSVAENTVLAHEKHEHATRAVA